MADNELLNSIKQLNNLLMQADSQVPVLHNVVNSFSKITGTVAMVTDNQGVVLAGQINCPDSDGYFKRLLERGSLAGESQIQKLIKKGQPVENEEMLVKRADGGEDKYFCSSQPVKVAGKHKANLLACSFNKPLIDLYTALATVGVGFVGLTYMHDILDQADQKERNKQLAEAAFDSLSYSEVEAIREILKNINKNESVVVASKIADSLGITRSVIVNALRKFESAGIIESRSLGMKGTFIRIKNTHALEIVASRSAEMDIIR